MKRVFIISAIIFYSTLGYFIYHHINKLILQSKPAKASHVVAPRDISDIECSKKPEIISFKRDDTADQTGTFFSILSAADSATTVKRIISAINYQKKNYVYPIADNLVVKMPKKKRKRKDSLGKQRSFFAQSTTNGRNIQRVFADVLPNATANDTVQPLLPKVFIPANITEDQLRKTVIDVAEQYLGTRYRWGGTSTTKGFDCSGFAKFVFAAVGIDLPHSSLQQSRIGAPINIEEAKAGDLLFFGYKRGNTYRTNHIAIVMSNDNGNIQMIHSAGKCVRIDDSNSMSWNSYYKKRLLFVKRII